MSSETDFGFAGEVHGAYAINSDFSFVGIGALGLTLLGTGELLPISVTAAVCYEHAGPLKLLAGLGFTYAPWLGAPSSDFGDIPSSFDGVSIVAEAIYPIPATRFGILAKFSISPLNNGLTITQIAAGVGAGF